jgi:predicted nucleic acid-binding Zn ribbon protein
MRSRTRRRIVQGLWTLALALVAIVVWWLYEQDLMNLP